MSEDRSLVRASEIGQWAYCQRAWWLAHVQRAPHEEPQVLARGVEAHTAHGAGVRRARLRQRAGVVLMMIALCMLLALLIGQGLLR